MRPSSTFAPISGGSVMPCRPMGRKDRVRNSMSAVVVSPTTATSSRSSSPPNLLNISRSKAPLRALAVPGWIIVLMINYTMFQLFHTTAGRASLFHYAL
jgi:hypothetical protein